MGLAALLLLPACNGGAEGAPCNRAKSNDDCNAGLVCTSNIEIAASTPRCCPRPPNRPTTSACAPAGKDFHPDAGVTPIGGSGGSGGTAGSGGASGSGGTAGSDAGGAGTGGVGGSDAGSAGAGGSGGSPADAGGG